VKTIAEYIETPCTDSLAKDISMKCTLEKMRSANKDKYDDRNQSGPNPEMFDPDKMYRKGNNRNVPVTATDEFFLAYPSYYSQFYNDFEM
jgi:hypothetical protein